MNQFWIDVLMIIVPSIATVGGIIATLLITGKNQREQQKELNKRFEKQIDEQRELFKAERRYDREMERLKVFNQVLMIDYKEHHTVIHYQFHGAPKFKVESYQKNIRPIIFENLHLMSQEVTNEIFKIDEQLQRSSFHESLEVEEEESLVYHYKNMIEYIKEYITEKVPSHNG
ncbi:hypothetical protein G4V62_18890 [Bacillaceae bacterium SIJ1]|uniref:hypothetical protein n=1 Tax=Litoribacterium kuwaitense TaxID=1398745 RepID=UPI0013ECCB07|nr:hypothetical protein [Litoribacterium kuwaitense]NGP46896.1 hypothetical protein [Litoribacterium kuwaitense]